MEQKFIKIGLISISDRASAGIYEDKGIPELEVWLKKTIKDNFLTESVVIPDDISKIKETLIDFCDVRNCSLIFNDRRNGSSHKRCHA